MKRAKDPYEKKEPRIFDPDDLVSIGRSGQVESRLRYILLSKSKRGDPKNLQKTLKSANLKGGSVWARWANIGGCNSMVKHSSLLAGSKGS